MLFQPHEDLYPYNDFSQTHSTKLYRVHLDAVCIFQHGEVLTKVTCGVYWFLHKSSARGSSWPCPATLKYLWVAQGFPHRDMTCNARRWDPEISSDLLHVIVNMPLELVPLSPKSPPWMIEETAAEEQSFEWLTIRSSLLSREFGQAHFVMNLNQQPLMPPTSDTGSRGYLREQSASTCSSEPDVTCILCHCSSRTLEQILVIPHIRASSLNRSGGVLVRQPAYVTTPAFDHKVEDGTVARTCHVTDAVQRDSTSPHALRRRDDWLLKDTSHLKHSQSPPGRRVLCTCAAAPAQ